MVGKDQPPDLAVYVPSNSVVVPELPNKTPSAQAPPKNVSAEKTKPVASRMTLIFSCFMFKEYVSNINAFINQFFSTDAAKPSKSTGNVKSVVQNSGLSVFKNPDKFVEEILDKTSALLLSEVIRQISKFQTDFVILS